MPADTLEHHITTIKNELTQIKCQLAAEKPQAPSAKWESIFGSFADSNGFEEAARLGREYREAQGSLPFHPAIKYLE